MQKVTRVSLRTLRNLRRVLRRIGCKPHLNLQKHLLPMFDLHCLLIGPPFLLLHPPCVLIGPPCILIDLAAKNPALCLAFLFDFGAKRLFFQAQHEFCVDARKGALGVLVRKIEVIQFAAELLPNRGLSRANFPDRSVEVPLANEVVFVADAEQVGVGEQLASALRREVLPGREGAEDQLWRALEQGRVLEELQQLLKQGPSVARAADLDQNDARQLELELAVRAVAKPENTVAEVVGLKDHDVVDLHSAAHRDRELRLRG